MLIDRFGTHEPHRVMNGEGAVKRDPWWRLRVHRVTLPRFRFVHLLSGTICADDVARVVGALLRPWSWTKGKHILEYECVFKQYVGAKYAFSFHAGRVALSAILEAMELGRGDEVILPGYTCVAVPNALLYRGIRPVYVDIELDSYGLDGQKLEAAITPRTKAVIVQHLYGLVCKDFERILETAQSRGLKVIEDCAHALGAQWRGRSVGTFGEAAFFSTEQSKVISTGMGGVAITNDPDLGSRLARIQARAPFPTRVEIARRLLQILLHYFRFHPAHGWWASPAIRMMGRRAWIGTTTDGERKCLKPRDYGKRLPNALALVGLGQIRKVERLNEHRRSIARDLDQIMTREGRKQPYVLEGSLPVYLRYPVLADDRPSTLARGREAGLELGCWFTSPIHPARVDPRRALYNPGSCPNAELAAKRAVNYPTHWKVKHSDVAGI